MLVTNASVKDDLKFEHELLTQFLSVTDDLYSKVNAQLRMLNSPLKLRHRNFAVISRRLNELDHDLAD